MDEGRREELRSGLEASILGEEHVDEERLEPGFLRGSETDVEAVLLGVPEAKRASERSKDQLLLSFLVSSSVSSRRVEDLKIENGEEEEELTFSERSCWDASNVPKPRFSPSFPPLSTPCSSRPTHSLPLHTQVLH